MGSPSDMAQLISTWRGGAWRPTVDREGMFSPINIVSKLTFIGPRIISDARKSCATLISYYWEHPLASKLFGQPGYPIAEPGRARGPKDGVADSLFTRP